MPNNHHGSRTWLPGFILLLFSTVLAAQESQRTNIVLVLADDLGYGELGCYGSDKIRTPNIDRLAREGVCFSQHYSGSPVCAPARCVLLTGKHTGHAVVRDNWENGGWEEGAPEGQYPFPEGTVTIASLLQDAGYATGAFGKWGSGGPASSGHPLRQGFDRFVGSLCQRQAHNYYPTHLWSDDERVDLAGNDFFKSHQKLSAPLENEDLYYERFARRSYATDHFIEGALEFLRAQRDEAFFLYYSSPIPHAALQVPRREVEAYRDAFPETPYLGNKGYLPHPTPRAAYAAMVSRLDREVGRILDELDALGLAKNTVVLFTSDNGPTFNGGSDSKFFDSAPGMRGLKCSVYEGGLRIPLVVRWPGKVAAGTWTEHLSGFQDMLPTLAEIAGLDLDGVALQLDGLSFVPTLGGAEEVAEHECLYWEYAGQQALRAGNWKGVRKRLRKGDLSLELYNLADDPGEQNDVAGEHPNIVARLEALLAREHSPSEAFPLPAVD
ncbi:MAG TPA: N-acetylgalactosamine-6-sulfatase [Planctomycetes bacterium]|nr:N-acetylgalactosamine-6-sulfatase [Planctomycetota bacterium]